MATPKPRVKVPKSIEPGVPFTVKARITHPMHTGLRNDRDGNLIPRHIINNFVVRFNDEEVISANLEPAVSADPYFEFTMAVVEPGKLEFEWRDNDGAVYGLSKQLNLS